MDDDGAVVHNDPRVAVLALDAEGIYLLPSELIFDLVGERVYLCIRVSGADHEVFGDDGLVADLDLLYVVSFLCVKHFAYAVGKISRVRVGERGQGLLVYFVIEVFVIFHFLFLLFLFCGRVIRSSQIRCRGLSEVRPRSDPRRSSCMTL